MIDQQTIDDTLSGLRMQRQIQLDNTDWAGLSDVTGVEDVLVYRQALRDLPGTITDDDLVNHYSNISSFEEYKISGNVVVTR